MNLVQIREQVKSPAIDAILNNKYVESQYAKRYQLQELATRIKKYPLIYPNANDLLLRIEIELKHLR